MEESHHKACFIILVDPLQIICEPLILQCQKAEESRLARALSTGQTEHVIEFDTRLKNPRDSPQHEHFQYFRGIGTGLGSQIFAQHIGQPFLAVPPQSRQIVPDGMKLVFVGDDFYGGLGFLLAVQTVVMLQIVHDVLVIDRVIDR